MGVYGPQIADSLLAHQRVIEATLADFTSGRNTAHLCADEIELVISALERRLESIGQTLVSAG